MTRQESMQKRYDDIMALKGVEDVKEIIKVLHDFLKDREPFALLNTMNDFIIIAKQEGGIKTVVNAVTEYLYAADTIEFSGKEKWFTFTLDYVHPNSVFLEIERFENMLSVLKGFNHHFKGVIHINLDKWVGRTDEAYFMQFLTYLSEIDHRVLFFFGVHTDNQDYIDNLKATITHYIRVETLSLRFPNCEELTDLVVTNINEKGFNIEQKAIKTLKKIISEMVTKKNFNGFSSIEKVSEDIIFHFLVRNKTNSKMIDNDFLTQYKDNSNYMKELSECIMPIRVMGFKTKEKK